MNIEFDDFEIDDHSLKKLLELLSEENQPRFQMEAVQLFTNLTGQQILKRMFEFGAIPKMLNLLKSKEEKVQRYNLGNMCNIFAEIRDVIIPLGGFSPILQIAANTKNIKLIQGATWAIHILLCTRPHLQTRNFMSAIPILCKIVQTYQDEKIITSSLFGLTYFLASKDSKELIPWEILQVLLLLLRHKTLGILVSAIRCLCAIVKDSEVSSFVLLKTSGFCSIILELLHHSKQTVRSETCWMIAHLAAASINDCLEILMNFSGLFDKLRSLTQQDPISNAIFAAANTIFNIIIQCKPERLSSFYEKGALSCFYALVQNNDIKLITIGLQSLSLLLNKIHQTFYEGQNLQALCIKDLKELEFDEILQGFIEHQNQEIKDAALQIHKLFA